MSHSSTCLGHGTCVLAQVVKETCVLRTEVSQAMLTPKLAHMMTWKDGSEPHLRSLQKMTLMLCHSSFVIYRVTRHAIVQIMPGVSYSNGRKERTPSKCSIVVLHTKGEKKEKNAVMLITHGKKRVPKSSTRSKNLVAHPALESPQWLE